MVRLYWSPVGAVSLTVAAVPAGDSVLTICTQKVSPTGARYWWIIVWFEPTVRPMALSQSLPTPITQELPRVVTKEAVGAPEVAFPAPIAPIAPEPLAPDIFTPRKLITVIEETALPPKLAVTVTLVSGAVANARHISAVPL